jgi:hypothetical protein
MLQQENAKELTLMNEQLRSAEQVSSRAASRCAIDVSCARTWGFQMHAFRSCTKRLTSHPTQMHAYMAQGRREAETKLHPLQQREADLAEELNRQKEKERLRKEYIEVSIAFPGECGGQTLHIFGVQVAAMRAKAEVSECTSVDRLTIDAVRLSGAEKAARGREAAVGEPLPEGAGGPQRGPGVCVLDAPHRTAPCMLQSA